MADFKWSGGLARVSLLTLGIGCGFLANAATFYVDRSNGKDSNSGLSVADNGSAGSGPWQTLSRVSLQKLQPGDQVLLRCGQSWLESLNLNFGGTADLPVKVGSYPVGCSDKPAVSGWVVPPTDGWELHSGSIYRLRLPLNVLTNGALTQSVQGWRTVTSSRGSGLVYSPACSGGGGCAAFRTGSTSGLMISPAFPIASGQLYTVRLQVLAPAGSDYGMTIRRFTAPYAMQSRYVSIKGSGDWQNVAFAFTASNSIDDARLDIDMPAGGITTYLKNVRIEPAIYGTKVHHVASSLGVMNPASHPNRGYMAAAPQSMYFSAGVSPVVVGSDGRSGSEYISTSSDFSLPPGGAVTPGISAWVRSQPWSLREHKVASAAPGRITLDGVTSYPLSTAGRGFFLTGALWMLDRPGEWFFDEAAKLLYVWMPDGQSPGSRIQVGLLGSAGKVGDPNRGIFPANISIENIAFRGLGSGLQIDRMKNISLKNVLMEEIAGMGVSAEGADGLSIVDSTFSRTRSDAIFALGAKNALIQNNQILSSGVVVDGAGAVQTLPRESYGAVIVGADSVVRGNTIRDASYIAVLAAGNNVSVQGNSIVGFARTLSDAGGVYTSGISGALISDNLIIGGPGDLSAYPSGISAKMSGVYLDDHSSTVTVGSNAIGDTDYCVHVHNSSRSVIQSNDCFLQRKTAIYNQEGSATLLASGDLYGNVVRQNNLFYTGSNSAVEQTSTLGHVAKFGSFLANRYATLSTPVVAQESSKSEYKSFTLAEWQSSTYGGLTRGIEVGGTIGAPLSSYAKGTLGGNLLADLSVAGGGWSLNGTGMGALGTSCGPKSSPCLTFTATAGQSGYISSQRFGLSAGQWYRVSFDAKTGLAGQTISAQVMRSGPTYENLMGILPMRYVSNGAWKRYSFMFQAQATVLAPPSQPGARIDFLDIAGGSNLSIANIEVAPVQATDLQPYATTIYNSSAGSMTASCPLAGSSQDALCSQLVDFSTGLPVTWPLSVPARKARMLFAQDVRFPDADRDGIANVQDQCPGTLTGEAVNSRGCSILQ